MAGNRKVRGAKRRPVLSRVKITLLSSVTHQESDGRPCGITVSGLRGLFAFLGYRHISNYPLDGEDPTIRASGLDVLDFSMRQRIREWVDFNLSIDNLTNKRYFATQNFFESTVSPTHIIACVHGTPGYSIGYCRLHSSFMGQEVICKGESADVSIHPRHVEIDTERLNELQAIIPALVFPNRSRPVRPCHSLIANLLPGILSSRVNAAVFDNRYGAILHKARPLCWKA